MQDAGQVPDLFRKFVDFLSELDSRDLTYELLHTSWNAVMVQVFVQGSHWEVEFFSDGRVQVEIFRSDGKIQDESILPALLKEWDR